MLTLTSLLRISDYASVNLIGVTTGSQSSLAVLLVIILCGWGGFLLRYHDGPPRRVIDQLLVQSVPKYHLEIASDSQSITRPKADQEIDLLLDSTLMLDLRPEQRVTGKIAVRSFIQHGDRPRPWPVQPHASSVGVFQLRAPVSELPELLPGRNELIFFVGRPELIFRHALEDLLDRSEPLPDGIQMLRATIHIKPDP